MTRSRYHHSGQVLPIFALLLVALLGITALVLDVGGAYAARRNYRSIADASALAGAADLQTSTRAVSNSSRTSARSDAMAVLVNRLGATSTGCDNTTYTPAADIINCELPGTTYRVSIKTPSPTCVNCDAGHAIQVTVRNPTFPLTFARLFGQAAWNIASTSVAGLVFQQAYAVVTLQPPAPMNNGGDANTDKDLIVSGNNTVLAVSTGDIGTNTDASTTNQGLISLDSGYFIYHYDNVPDQWSKPDGINPQGQLLRSLIADPVYPVPPTPPQLYPSDYALFLHQTDGVTPCGGAWFPVTWSQFSITNATCYRPGVYADSHGFLVGTSGAPSVAYLSPGVYVFPKGVTVRGTLGGGLVSGSQAVDLVVPQNQKWDSNNAVAVLLNMGNADCSSSACTPAAATDGTTTYKTSRGFPLTIEVPRDNGCFDPSSNLPLNSSSCSVNQNGTINMGGNGLLRIGGVLYGPSDNMQINASSQGGQVGQIWSWSVTYTGGATLSQTYGGAPQVGIPRLDAACTAPSTPCNSP